MFNPFKGFETNGYLRNNFKAKGFASIKRLEHEGFVRNAAKAIKHLSLQQYFVKKSDIPTDEEPSHPMNPLSF